MLVVGAGLSGIGAGYRLQTECPEKSYAIVEARDALGGTWDLFRFPGVRSDSDMFTLSYPFRPWREERALADGSTIRKYIEETASEHGIDRRIRFGHRVTAASWESSQAVWTVSVEGAPAYTCRFLYLCSGYYRYDRGHQPPFPGQDRFTGPVVHPQRWPASLDYTGKSVLVIGSGATAATLVPALARTASHVTMLQRSPSYFLSLAGVDPVARAFNRYVPAGLSHRANRLRSIVVSQLFYQFCRRFPETARRRLRQWTADQLPAGCSLDPDFAPRYDPWDQRMCIVEDGDLFGAIRDGRASVVTDTIASFTETGVELGSGRFVEADVIVTATGLELVPAGGIAISVDGASVRLGDSFVHRGCMVSGVPNLALCFGYTNASWTLRADLTSRYVCRLLRHMDRHGYEAAVPEHLVDEAPLPFLNLTSGYVRRATDLLPKQGSRAPWRVRQNYLLDYFSARFGDLSDQMRFVPAPSRGDEMLAAAS